MKKIIFLLTLPIIFLAWINFASADISHPYVVDEKSQVLLGDSVPIEVPNADHTATTTYYGFENYHQDYVNGFVHFTYTYSHSKCCYANYSPVIYITDIDPRTYWRPIEKDISEVFRLGQMEYGRGHETDWYFYEVQFDETGYSVVVKQAGLTEVENRHYSPPEYNPETDWFSLANRNPVIGAYSMTFTPIPVKSKNNINPVIIIPGIMGSAKKNGELLIDPILHTYDDLIATLEANGYQKGKNLFDFPYEWRDSNVITANLLKEKIREVEAACEIAQGAGAISQALGATNCAKVDLIAHSMGGLVAREYIQSGQYRHDVDQLIFLGTPHKGSPNAYLRWEGAEFGTETFDKLTKQLFTIEAWQNFYPNLFSYIHNRPISTVQELLPIFDYLKDKDTGILRNYPNNYPPNIFLEVLNTETNISKLLNSGVKITNITGVTGDNTVEKIRVGAGENPLWTNGKPDGFDGQTTDRGLEKGEGDGTVTTFGSTLDDSIQNEVWNNISHQKLPRETSARIFNLFTNKVATDVIFLSPVEKIFSIHLQSPIDVVITAPDGKKIGKNFATGQEYSEIAGAFYSGFNNGDEEYITIPNPIDSEYKIEVQGTGSGGEYGVLTSLITEATSTTNQITGITEPNQITELDVVIDNANPQNLETEKKVTFDILISDINGSYDLKWIKDKKTRDMLIKQVDGAIKLQKKIETIYEKLPDGTKRKKRVEKLEVKVDKILLRLFSKELDFLLKKQKINQQAFDLLKADIKYLLENN